MQKEHETIVLGEERYHPFLSKRMGGIELPSLTILSSLLLFSESTDQKRKSRTMGVPAACVLLLKALVAFSWEVISPQSMSTGFGIVNTRGRPDGKESTEFVIEVCVCGSIIIMPPPKPPDTGSRSVAQTMPVTRFLESTGTPDRGFQHRFS